MSDQEEFYENDKEVPEVEKNIARMPSGISGEDSHRQEIKEEDLENVEDKVNDTNKALDRLNEMDDEDQEHEHPLEILSDDQPLREQVEGEEDHQEIVNEGEGHYQEEVNNEGEGYYQEEEFHNEGEGEEKDQPELQENDSQDVPHFSEPGKIEEENIDRIDNINRPATDSEIVQLETDPQSPEKLVEMDEQEELSEEEIDPKLAAEKLNEEININLIEIDKLRKEVKALEDQELEDYSIKGHSSDNPITIKLEYAKSKCNETIIKEKIDASAKIYKEK